MARQTRISFNSQSEVLEGIFSTPTESGSPWPAIVLYHPDPWMGGTMDSPVIRAIANGLDAVGIATLRFNYRGVGESTGKYEEGRGEREDAYAAFQLLADWPDTDESKLGAVGYSFGATMAVLAALEGTNAQGVVALSAPVGLLESEELKRVTIPMLILGGENDLMAPPAKLLEAKSGLGAGTEIAIVPNADRGWSGAEDELTGRVTGFFEKLWNL